MYCPDMTSKDRLNPTTAAGTTALALPCSLTAGLGRSESLSLTLQTVEVDSMNRSKWCRAERLANRISQLADYAQCDVISEEETAEIERAAGELFGVLLNIPEPLLHSAVDALKG